MKIVLALLALTATAHANDLEKVLDSAAQSTAPKVSREQSFLVDTLRSLQDKAPTMEQAQFFRELEASNWDNAFAQYPAAFAETTFGRSPNGGALEAFLHFKAGLTITGLEKLVAVKEPKKIHFYLLNLWREAAPESHASWSVARVDWTQDWTEVLGMGIEVKVKARQIGFSQGVAQLSEMAKRAPTDSRERGLIEWNLALAYSMNDQADEAAKIMAALLKSPNNPVSEDLIHLTAARLLFQKGYFDAAVRYYEKIPKASDYWLEAQEEIAWSYIRKGQPQNALAVTKTLVNPLFKGQTGPESHFVRALAQLKICDYPGVVGELQTFPKTFKARALEMRKISNEPGQPAVVRVLSEMQKRPLRWEDLGGDSQLLPRMITRDQALRDLIAAQNELEREAKAAQALGAKLPGRFDGISQDLALRASAAKTASLGRIQELAAREVKETKSVLDKLHIVEAEVIQQVAMSDKVARKVDAFELKEGSTGARDRDVLKFKAGADVWFDELANYKVDVSKACQVRR